jgi:nucleotidyltransferase/DNA polymerase involved in DNA repair
MGTEAGAEQSPFGAGTLRKIIHIDMDAFYASVEQRDNPELRGKPVAVGGSRERGVVAAASYEARAFGVHSAMPSITAKRKCPDLIFVKPRFDAYKAISLQIREIFAAYTPIIEPLSLDEAYLDVTENLKGINLATQIAEEIRARIRAEIEITASAGVSYNKFLAKLASDHRKPDGLFVITPKMGPSFVETLPVRKFHGIGPATARKMAQLGIETGLDLKGQTLEFLQHPFQQGGRLLLLGRARRRRAACPRRPDQEIRRRREHLSRRSPHLRSRARCACRNRRQGVGVLRGLRHARPHRHPQGEVRQLSDHHAQPHRSNAGQDAGRTRRSRQRVARTAFSGGERHPAPRHLPVFTRAGGGGTRARIQPACLERDPVRLKLIRHWRGN